MYVYQLETKYICMNVIGRRKFFIELEVDNKSK